MQKNILKVEKLKSPEYIKELEADLRKKIEAELKAELENTVLSATEVPDLTNAAAAGNNSEAQAKAIEDVNDLFDEAV